MKKLLFLILLEVYFCFPSLYGQATKVQVYQKTFTTYPFSDPNPIPMVFSPVYPYFRYDGFTTKPVQKSWKVVELENDYIRLLILPEIGGKVWAAIEKSTQKPFIYYNHVIKFRDIAMRGPWTSGGMEANYGIIGHTPNCATPVDYTIQKNSDSSVSCFIGVLDLLTRNHWRVEINLPKDKAYFTTRSLWYNGTSLEQPYYHWMNIGLKASGNLEFIFPGNRYLGHEGEYSDWPKNKNGKDIRFYNENNFGGYKSYHVFGKYTDFFGAYWHDDQMGFVRYGYHDDKPGKKIWIWGLSQQGMIWEKLLTDTDGQYVEVQSGRLFNQNSSSSTFTPFKHRSMEPYSSETWKEYWYPVLGTEGIKFANEWGSLNYGYQNNRFKFQFCPVQFFNDTIEVVDGEKVLYQKALDFKPLKTFVDSFDVNSLPSKLTVQLKVHSFTYNLDEDLNILSRPVETVENFDWNSSYGLYLQGKEFMDQKLFPQAEEKLRASYTKDSSFIPLLVKLSELCFRNMQYQDALHYSNRALKIDTQDGGANYFYGLANLAFGNLVDARDGFDLASQSMEYRSSSFTELCRIYLREKQLIKAEHYANKALVYNQQNMEALKLLAFIYRQQDDRPKAASTIDRILQLDPLNHFAVSEKYWLDPTSSNANDISNTVTNELPQETYLETAIWYYRVGAIPEAIFILKKSPPSTITEYWLAWLQKRPLDKQDLKPDLLFPFRNETGAILEELIKQEDHWLLKYHLALIYLDRNRLDEAGKLLKDCEEQPDAASFYVVRSMVTTDSVEKERNLVRAVSIDTGWRYIKLLAEYYNQKFDYSRSQELVGKYFQGHPGNYIIGLLYAKTLLLNGQYRDADGLLSKLEIIPFEGATEGRVLYRETKLMQAIQWMKQRKFKRALDYIDQSQQWPENLGVGKPYEPDIDLRLEYWMRYLCQNGKRQTTELDKIIGFTPAIENTVSNFEASNAVVTAWALRERGRSDEALTWLDNQIKKFPGNLYLEWSQATYQNKSFPLDQARINSNMRVLLALLEINDGKTTPINQY